MKKRTICLLFFCAVCLFETNAQFAGDRPEITLEGGQKAVIVSSIEVPEDLMQKIITALTAAWNIPGLEGNSASVLVEPSGEFRFALYPTELTYLDIDFIQYLPSGMAFYYTTALFYDITMKVDEYAPKIAGLFISAEDLLKNMYTASVMPDMFMFDSYLLNRVSRLEQALMAKLKKTLFSKTKPVSEEIILAIRGYYNENPAITKKEAAERLKADGLKATKNDIDAVFMVLLGKIE